MSVRWERIAFIAFCLSLGLLLALRGGNAIDEVEHLHAAWLISARDLKPIDGFFEHHPPLLWHLLGLVFRAGFHGPEAIYPARLLIVGLCALFCLALLRLQTSLAAEAPRAPWLGIAVFGAMNLFAPMVFVIRPESLALGLFGLAMLAVASELPLLFRNSLAGVLAMLAALASPRFALLAPALLLLARPGEQRILDVKRLAMLSLGAVIALGLCFATLLPPKDLLFDLRFSALLQQVGSTHQVDLRFLPLCLGAFAIAIALAACLYAPPRLRELIAWVLHGALIWLICLRSTGSFVYEQAYAPALVWPCLLLVWLQSHPAKELRVRVVPWLMPALLAVLAIAAIAKLRAELSAANNLIAATSSRRMLLEALPAGATVLLMTPYHPIAIDDASYWGNVFFPLAPGHICEGVAEYRRPQSRAGRGSRLARC